MAELYSLQDRPKKKTPRWSYDAALARMHKNEEKQARQRILDAIRWDLGKGFALLGKTELELQVSIMMEDLARVP